MKICIIIPAYNEEKYIGPIVEAAGRHGVDVLVIDDGSTDQTGVIARDKGAFVVRHDQKNGKGYSLIKGFDYALGHGYDAVITMDGDGQHDPNDIPAFLMAAEQKNAYLITGNRMHNPAQMPFIRLCTNRFMSWLISIGCQQLISDTQCGYRYIASQLLREVKFTCQDFQIETEILMKASKYGYQIDLVDVKSIYRDEKSNINPLTDTIRFIAYFIKELFTSKRQSSSQLVKK